MQKYYYKLNIQIKMIHNIHLSDYNEYMSNYLNKIMLNDNYLKTIHSKTTIKGYVFSNLYPYDKDCIYKKDSIYTFYLNGFDKELIMRFKNCLEQEEIILNVNMSIQPFKKIKVLRTNSLCLVSLKDSNAEYWTRKKSLSLLIEALNKNANSKIGLFCNEILKDTNFIQSLLIRNKYDLCANYKGGKLIGYQLDIIVNDDLESQLLANICMAVGLGEKNSLGCGFCIDLKGDKR